MKCIKVIEIPTFKQFLNKLIEIPHLRCQRFLGLFPLKIK